MRRITLSLTLAVLALAGCGGTTHHAGQSAAGSVHPPGWGKPAPSSRLLGPTAVPSAVMFDSVNLSTFPASPFAAAGYTAGTWPNYLTLVRTYPRAHVVSIAIGWGYRARCLDVEPGDAVPGQAAPWVRADIAAGFHKPCVYSSYWEFVNQVRPDLAAGGIARSAVFEWDASFTGRPGITPTFDATQWTDHAFGRHLDQSTVTLAFLGINPKPRPTPPKPRVICFGARAQGSATCRRVHAQVRHWSGAESSSSGAYRARGCPSIGGRRDWFARALGRHPHTRVAYRRGALRSSRRAYSGQQCPLFAHRAAYFAAQIAASHKRYGT